MKFKLSRSHDININPSKLHERRCCQCWLIKQRCTESSKTCLPPKMYLNDHAIFNFKCVCVCACVHVWCNPKEKGRINTCWWTSFMDKVKCRKTLMVAKTTAPFACWSLSSRRFMMSNISLLSEGTYLLTNSSTMHWAHSLNTLILQRIWQTFAFSEPHRSTNNTSALLLNDFYIHDRKHTMHNLKKSIFSTMLYNWGILHMHYEGKSLQFFQSI